MKETSLTIEQIETLIVGYPHSPFYCRKNIVIPNVSWGFLNHEADLLIISKANMLTEVEIKRSWSDFMADFKKKHSHYDRKLSHFYYAVPESIGERVFNFLYYGEYRNRSFYDSSKVERATENNPNSFGLILYSDNDIHPLGRAHINVLSARLGKYKITVHEEIKLLRLLGMRIWKMKRKLAEYQVMPSLLK